VRLCLSAGALAFAAALAACGHVPLSMMYHLRNFGPRTADPAALRVAVRIPNALQLQPGDVNLAVAYWREGEDANKREEKFLLEELPAEVAYLTAEQRPGTHLHAFRIAPADVPRMRALQTGISAGQRRGRNHGTLGIGADTCHRGGWPDGPMYMTTFIKADEAQGFLTLLENVDLRTAVPKGKTLDEFLPPCGKVDQSVEGRT
jgi:hypothetical protein